jgi:hypothetical protein
MPYFTDLSQRLSGHGASGKPWQQALVDVIVNICRLDIQYPAADNIAHVSIGNVLEHNESYR